MKQQSPLPRLAREGFVPAGPEKRVNKRAMLIPKTGHVADHSTTLMDFSEVLCPPERRALREIIETAEVVREGDHLYLVARVSAATLDSLATFETSRDDLEEEPDAEQVNEDGTNESDLEVSWAGGGIIIEEDLEYDFQKERQRYIVDRQRPGRQRHDRSKDREELRKAKAFAAKKRKRVKA